MATSGEATGGNDVFNGRARIFWWLVSQDPVANTSTVRWAWCVNWAPGDGCHWIRSHEVNGNGIIRSSLADNTHPFVSGHAHSGDFPSVNPTTGGGFASGTYVIAHGAAGEGQVQLSIAYNDSAGVGSFAITPVTDLPTIPRQPSAPGTPSVSGHTDSDPTTATISWSTPSNQGAGLTQRQIQISANSNFTSLVVNSTAAWGTSYNATGLQKGTTYWTRVRAATSAGFGPYSGTRQFTTGATTPSAPPQPTVSSIGPTSAVVSWSAPSDSGGTGITGYDVQRATDAGFTQNVVTVSDSASPNTLTGLLPATTYWTRVRAKNSEGSGSYSTARQFTTSSRVKVGNGSQWRDARVYVGNGSAWVPVVPHVGNGSAWI